MLTSVSIALSSQDALPSELKEHINSFLDTSDNWTIHSAACHGYLHLMHYLVIQKQTTMTEDEIEWGRRIAGEQGDMSYIEWSVRHHKAIPLSCDVMDLTAANGHLLAVQWLDKKLCAPCTSAAMDGAAANGFLDVLRWLHRHRSEGGSMALLDVAAANGHIKVVNWLLRNRDEGNPTLAKDYAVYFGHLELAKMLQQCEQPMHSNLMASALAI